MKKDDRKRSRSDHSEGEEGAIGRTASLSGRDGESSTEGSTNSETSKDR